mgnify:CR=1 FL=1
MDLLTKVIVETISKKCNDGSFGISLINIPSVNYADLVSNISLSKKTDIFFLCHAVFTDRACRHCITCCLSDAGTYDQTDLRAGKR